MWEKLGVRRRGEPWRKRAVAVSPECGRGRPYPLRFPTFPRRRAVQSSGSSARTVTRFSLKQRGRLCIGDAEDPGWVWRCTTREGSAWAHESVASLSTSSDLICGDSFPPGRILCRLISACELIACWCHAFLHKPPGVIRFVIVLLRGHLHYL